MSRINITSELLSYNIEVMNAFTISMSVPALYVQTISTLPYYLAQAVVFSMWSLGSMIPAIGIATACFEMLYVTNFSSLFAWCPEKVGRLTFIVITIFCLVPNLLITIDSTWKGGHAAAATAFFIGQAYQNNGLSGLGLLTAVLVLICVAMLAISYLIIPCYLKVFRTASDENRLPANIRFSLKRVLFVVFYFSGALVFIIIVYIRSENERVPKQGYVITFSVNFTLLMLLMLDKDASTFTKRHFFTHLTSVETIPVPNQQVRTNVFVVNCSQTDRQVTIVERLNHDEGVPYNAEN